jgi:hypothetical protein
VRHAELDTDSDTDADTETVETVEEDKMRRRGLTPGA